MSVETVRMIFGVGSVVLERHLECLRSHFQMDSKVTSFPDIVTQIKRS